MRYRLRAKLEGNVFVRERVVIDRDELRVEFIIDSSDRITDVAVSLVVPSDAFSLTMIPDHSDTSLTIRAIADLDVHEKLMNELRSLESHMAFATNGALKRIRWDQVVSERIAENPANEADIAFTSVGEIREYPPAVARFVPEGLRALVSLAPIYEELMLPKAFFREGLNEFASLRYIQAYYDFFFVVEDFFARGKSGLESVRQEFRKSSELGVITELALDKVREDTRHRNNLDNFFAEENCAASAEGAQELILKVRGRLHHFSSRSSKRTGTPFNQDRFETMALFAMQIAELAIRRREAQISMSLRDSDPTRA